MASLMQSYPLCVGLVQIPASSVHNKTLYSSIIANLQG
jgi:hypothetical protein